MSTILKLVFGFLALPLCLGQEVSLPSITIGTNTYNHVTVRKRNDTEAIVKFKGGLTMMKLADLPEPLRSEWFDSNKVARARDEALRKENEIRERKRIEEEKVRQAIAEKLTEPPKKVRDDDSVTASPRTAQPKQYEESMDPLKAFSVLLLLIAIYFIPSGVAQARKHRNSVGVFLVNLFLGWTLLGWVFALVWACYQDQPTAK